MYCLTEREKGATSIEVSLSTINLINNTTNFLGYLGYIHTSLGATSWPEIQVKGKVVISQGFMWFVGGNNLYQVDYLNPVLGSNGKPYLVTRTFNMWLNGDMYGRNVVDLVDINNELHMVTYCESVNALVGIYRRHGTYILKWKGVNLSGHQLSADFNSNNNQTNYFDYITHIDAANMNNYQYSETRGVVIEDGLNTFNYEDNAFYITSRATFSPHLGANIAIATTTANLVVWKVYRKEGIWYKEIETVLENIMANVSAMANVRVQNRGLNVYIYIQGQSFASPMIASRKNGVWNVNAINKTPLTDSYNEDIFRGLTFINNNSYISHRYLGNISSSYDFSNDTIGNPRLIMFGAVGSNMEYAAVLNAGDFRDNLSFFNSNDRKFGTIMYYNNKIYIIQNCLRIPANNGVHNVKIRTINIVKEYKLQLPAFKHYGTDISGSVAKYIKVSN
jgi:hypothetical protein